MCMIQKAGPGDLPEILRLQYLAFQDVAAMFPGKAIQPLTQTLEELRGEYDKGAVLKMTAGGALIGSVRAWEQDGTVFIGKLIVHPGHRRRGHGARLLAAVEQCFPGRRYELFTSTKNPENIRLYEKLGYRIFACRAVDSDLEFVFMEKTGEGAGMPAGQAQDPRPLG